MRGFRKIAIVVMVVALLVVLCACPQNGNGNVPDGDNENAPNNGGENTSSGGEQNESEVTKMYVTIYGNKLEITLENNSSVSALVELLKQGAITYTASDYGGFEKVCNIGHSLPTNNSQITTQAGDVVLYQGNQICLMVGSNSWSYTRIGKIKGHSASELKKLLHVTGNDSAEVTLSLD